MSIENQKILSPNRIEPIRDFREKGPKMNRELFIKILENGGISKNNENVTPNDLFSIPKELTKNEILNLIAVTLEIKPEELEENMEKLSECFHDAKLFLNEYLLQGFPKEIQKIDGFKNQKQLLNFLRKTKTLSKGEPMTFSPIACSLTLVTLAEWEYRKGNFEGLKNESKYIDNKLFEKDKDGISRFHERAEKKDKDWLDIGVYTGENEYVNASYTYRGKGKDSTVNKILRKPELTAKEVIKDGIGLKFEVKTKEDAQKLITFLSKNLQSNFEMSKLFISNIGGLLSEENMTKLNTELDDKNIKILEENNSSSHKSFQTLKLEGEIRVPENGEDGRKMIDRNFEIQITLTNNNNETGLAQHSIYKRAQKLSTYTRLFGSFSEKYLNMICEEASQVSSLGVKKIKDYFKERFLVKLYTPKTKKPKFGSKDQIIRWQKANFLPQNVFIRKK